MTETQQDSGIVTIHGRQYATVAKRVQDFRHDYGTTFSIETEILCAAELVQVRAVIRDYTGRVISTGHAEEERGSTNINKTSAIENCETSAVGRALAFMGIQGSTDIRSADEMADAINKQAEKAAFQRAAACSQAVRDHWDSVRAVQESLANGDYSAAKEAWFEIPEADQHALWMAPTKGGIFTTREREQMKSPEWSEA